MTVNIQLNMFDTLHKNKPANNEYLFIEDIKNDLYNRNTTINSSSFSRDRSRHARSMAWKIKK